MVDKTPIDFLRHGEPQGGDRLRGSQDDPLSNEGWQQMYTTAKRHALWQTIITSPMERCKAFSASMGREKGIGVLVQEDLKEMHFGGLGRQKLYRTSTDGG